MGQLVAVYCVFFRVSAVRKKMQKWGGVQVFPGVPKARFYRNPLALMIFQGEGFRTPQWIHSCIPKDGVGLSSRSLKKLVHKQPFTAGLFVKN